MLPKKNKKIKISVQLSQIKKNNYSYKKNAKGRHCSPPKN